MGVTICLPYAETSEIKILKLHFVLENLDCNPPGGCPLEKMFTLIKILPRQNSILGSILLQ